MVSRKILFVSGYYPPHAPPGAVRPPRLVRHWLGAGHDVRVVAVDNPALGASLAGSAPAGATAVHLPWNGQSGGRSTGVGRDSVSGGAMPPAPTVTASGRTRKRGPVKRFYQQLMTTPDRYRGWTAHVLRQVEDWQRAGWTPDIVYSSGPPHRSHIAAAKLRGRTGTPWVAELRDPWGATPYENRHPLLSLWNRALARRTLNRADALVAVTQTDENAFRARYSAPVALSYNGYDPSEFAELEESPAPHDSERLTILHAGFLYPGRRDPAALLQALQALGERADDILVSFYGEGLDAVEAQSRDMGLQGSVRFCGVAPRRSILELERAHDVLLLCRWDDPRDDGTIPGKLFEYIGARRPVLCIGSETGEAVDIVRTAQVGFVSNDPAAIAGQLLRWLEEKRAAGGRVPDLPEEGTAAYRAAGQFVRIDSLMDEVLRRARPSRSAHITN